MNLEYAFNKRPRDGEAQSVADNVLWLRMPLPFSLNHINLWLLRNKSAWVIVDTGLGNKETLDTWRQVFSAVMLDDPASHIVATHLHPDHVGCAGFLARHFDVDLWMSRDEFTLCRKLLADAGQEVPVDRLDFYKRAGFTDDQLVHYKTSFGTFSRQVTPLPESAKRLSDGDKLNFAGQTWQVVTGGGHSPEHACFYNQDTNLLISGDQLLPTITPNVSVWPLDPGADPLNAWFKSLRKLRDAVPEDVLVLPAHGKPFRGAHARIDTILNDHEQRLERLQDWCREPRRAVDVFPPLYNSRIDDSNRIFAVGEALAHLHYLLGRGEMVAETRYELIHYQSV